MDWIITLPKTVKWEEYQLELDRVSDGTEIMNYKLPFKPKSVKKGDRCFITHKGFVRGWMRIVGVEENEFRCTTTNRNWGKAFYLQRSGVFHKIKPLPYPGFRGFREFKFTSLVEEEL